MNNLSDEELWRIARRRADFKRNLYSYIVVNIFLWVVWWFQTGYQTGLAGKPMPWPVWVMLGWGVGLAFQYFKAYPGTRKGLAEKEFEKLKRKQS